jgi:hypothetical protein
VLTSRHPRRASLASPYPQIFAPVFSTTSKRLPIFRALQPLCFHTNPNAHSCNSFSFSKLQMPRGWVSPSKTFRLATSPHPQPLYLPHLQLPSQVWQPKDLQPVFKKLTPLVATHPKNRGVGVHSVNQTPNQGCLPRATIGSRGIPPSSIHAVTRPLFRDRSALSSTFKLSNISPCQRSVPPAIDFRPLLVASLLHCLVFSRHSSQTSRLPRAKRGATVPPVISSPLAPRK